MVTVMNDELIEIREKCLAEAIRSGLGLKTAEQIVDRAKEFEKYMLRDVEVHNDGK